MLEKTKKAVAAFKEIRSALSDSVKAIVQNREIPLDDRWDLFIDSDFGEESGCIVDLESIDLENYYGDSWINRYQTLDFGIIIEHLTDDAEDAEDLKAIQNAKEEILQKFIKSFIYDW